MLSKIGLNDTLFVNWWRDYEAFLRTPVLNQTSFPVIHKFDNVGIFYYFNFENLMDIVISYLNFNSKHYDKCTLVVQLISLVNTSNLFSLENANITNFVYYGKTWLSLSDEVLNRQKHDAQFLFHWNADP